MLVHIREVTFVPNSDQIDYDTSKYVTSYKVKSYDTFVKMIQTFKKHRKDILIGDSWYTVEDYALSFPNDSEHVPVIYVYVISY